MRNALEQRYFEFKNLPYGHFSAKKGKCGVNYYHSGKLVVNGKEAQAFVEFCLEPEILGEVVTGYDIERNPEMFEPHFGIDEAGKGDFFGPLVIAGVFVNKEIAKRFLDAGVKDSKKLTDKRADDLGELIEKELKDATGSLTACEIISIGPARYNELYNQFRNLNSMLAWAHAKVIENLKGRIPDCPRALSDQFARPQLIESQLEKKNVQILLQQRTKAESDIAVAAASILARRRFLHELDKLGEKPGEKLLKGAGAQVLKQGKKIFKNQGIEVLATVSKRHFKTFREATEPSLI